MLVRPSITFTNEGVIKSAMLTVEEEERGMFPPLPCSVRAMRVIHIQPLGAIPEGAFGYIGDRCPITGALSIEFEGVSLAVLPFEDEETLDALRVVNPSMAKLRWLPLAAAELLFALNIIPNMLT